MGDRTLFEFTQNDAGVIGHGALEVANSCLKYARFGNEAQREDMLIAMHQALSVAEQVRQIMKKPVNTTPPTNPMGDGDE